MRLTVLEQIHQSDYIVVLAHLEHLDLSPLLDYLDWLHILLLDCLDSDLLLAHFVRGLFYQAELAFAQGLPQHVVVEQV